MHKIPHHFAHRIECNTLAAAMEMLLVLNVTVVLNLMCISDADLPGSIFSSGHV